MNEEYDIEPWMDSTSTATHPGGPMPGEAEGLQLAVGNHARTGFQMLNAWETLNGIGEMASGIANDGVRLTGGTPREDAPSFSRDLGHLGKSLKEDTFGTLGDMITAPGSIPGFFTGMKMPKIPRGTGWNLLRERPGYKDVRNSLKDVDRYNYVSPEFKNDLKARRVKKRNFQEDIEKALLEQEYKGELMRPFSKQERVLSAWDNGKGKGGQYQPRENTVIFPQRTLNPRQKEILSDQGLLHPDWRKHVERHEDFHARREFLKPGSGPNKGFMRNRQGDNWINEAGANMTGEKSISGGLSRWARNMHAKNKDGSYVYDAHMGPFGRGAAAIAGVTTSAARQPLLPLVAGAAPLQNIEEYEIE